MLIYTKKKTLKALKTMNLNLKLIMIGLILLSCSSKKRIVGNYSISEIIYKPQNQLVQLTDLNTLNIISFKKNNYCKFPGIGEDNTNCSWELIDSENIKINCQENTFKGKYSFIYQEGKTLDTLILKNDNFIIKSLRL